jgi:peptidyl-prolyl cis-trans isomerase D
MFDLVTKHKRLMMIFLVLFIVPTFAFFGIQSYEGLFRTGRSEVAQVAGQSISVMEFNRALDEQRDRLRAMLGRDFDPQLLESPQARREFLDGLIAQRALLAYAEASGMTVSAEQLAATILATPVFQENGQFSRERYQALLRGQNLSEPEFEARVRRDLLLQQLGTGLIDSAFVSRTVARDLATARAQGREIAEAVFPAVQFARQVKVTPEAVEAYYKAHPKEFEQPEMVQVEYVVLSLDALAGQEKVTPEEVKAWYAANIAPRFTARAEARKRIDAVAAELRKDPSRFEELAKANSEDPGSAGAGGDLGWFGRGAMVKPFEDVVFKLKENETSGVVETEFGFHIIRVTGVRKDAGKGEERRASHILVNAPKAEQDFDSARAGIERELRLERVGKRFAELADQFSNIAYEQPDSLQPLADRFKLPIERSGWITRGAARPPLDHPKLLAALFGAEAIRDKRNTEAIETAPNRLVAARVVEHRPPTVRPIGEVSEQITKRLIDEEALRLAVKAGSEKLAELQAGRAPTLTWGQPRVLSREAVGALDPRAVGPVFRADASKPPVYVGVELPPTGYTIYRIGKVIEAKDLDEAKLRGAETALARLEAREAYQGLVTALKERSKVTINERNIEARER